jgi:hypothetical protein
MVLTPQLKDAGWMIELKNKIQLFFVFTEITSLAKHIPPETERIEDDIPKKWNSKARKTSHIHT